MTKLLTLITLPSLLAVGQSTNISEIHVALSPLYAGADKENIHDRLTRFILEAPPGSRITCDDAYNLQSIAVFTVPALRFDSRANRARTLAGPLAALGLWFAKTNNPGAPGDLRGSALLRVPEWLQQVSVQGSDLARSIIIVGSPLYVSATESTFSMPPDLYPGDGHLLATLDQSIYGLGEPTNCLVGVTLHWCYPSEQVFANDLHAHRLRRFWSLYSSLRGGLLSDFSADLASTLARATKGGLPPVGRFQVESGDTKLEMRVARPRDIPRWMPQQVSATNLPAARGSTPVAQPTETAAPASPAVALPWQSPQGVVQRDRAARPVVFAVGLMWQARADIDLYITPPGAPELFFGNVLGPSGRYLHDFRDANSHHDYEWVELWQEVEPSQVAAWVNYFAGDGPVRGTVCVYYHGQKYLAPFELRATRGNSGADGRNRELSPYWLKLDLAKIVAGTPVP
jgi:hypothetical protein